MAAGTFILSTGQTHQFRSDAVVNVHVANPEVALPILIDYGAITGGPEVLQPHQSARLLQNIASYDVTSSD
jgi:hypothetical protein